ncbi:Clan CD, family C14, metacaspase-like cysteine peptidase [Tritrichomonas foetus]|uniref:Clan CD, family C14, metacaspase-like cysteine peptidase n=1 Tax=Tritrichomonas foetus TaxID=1144522 RepID=A0A1J4KMY4_9EUKA|nr:Clan CD, family C14, metacaspase-like cysteine peptidase [Tritrichomonas foetus]|eukprot:OHT12595.1 Clan CD, family C14, metacaspase-like cysteine peptidase [Tritrichomonas foetus]
MGQEGSSTRDHFSDSSDDAVLDKIKKEQTQQVHMDANTRKEQFQELRGSNTIEASLKIMNHLGICLNDLSPNKVPPQLADGISSKVLLIVVNTYTKPKYQLGVGPLNDSITVAINHKKMGYKMVFLHNTTPKIFKSWLQFVLEKSETDLTIFYTGHGCSVVDKSGDESDGYDEVMLFDTGYVIDDELAEYLAQYAHGQRIVLLSDCCHSGSMWDIQSHPGMKGVIPDNIMSISASKDDQTAKQTKIKSTDQGIFSYYFWDLFNKDQNITTKQMETKINPYISRFKQHFTYATTSPSMLDEPIFPHRERPPADHPNRGHTY